MTARNLAIVFALATAFFWGVYGPALGKARSPNPPSKGGWSAYKPYVFIGAAYLVWGCLGGLAAMKIFGDSFSFSGTQQPAATWGFIAGSLGAFGALTLTFAMMNAGKAQAGPGLVMPIVFGGAVTVTAITNLILMRGHATASPLLWVGMLLVAAGIVLVAKFTPHAGPHAPAASAAPAHAAHVPERADEHAS
jgi:drug/metabolite transporter (DMT)-like permease